MAGNRSRLRGHVLTAVVALPVGIVLSWWASSTEITAGTWAIVLVAGLTFVVMLLGPKAVKR